VPFESKHGEESTTLFMQSGLVNYFVFEQLDKNRKKFEKITPAELEKEIKTNPYYFSEFKKHLSQTGLMFNLDSQKEKTLHYLHAEFVHQLFSEKQYYDVLLKNDVILEKVLKK
jgi:carboxyl-terminal processing protease